MRLLLAAHHSSLVSGAETYVDAAARALAGRGHDVALLVEHPPVAGRHLVGAGASRWCTGEIGTRAAIAAAREWRADVVYLNGVSSVTVERAAMSLAPPVLFAHSYAGLCISGSRTWQSSDTPCPRRLGPLCTLHYFPHRCGGKSPVTMVRDYARQRARQALQRGYRRILVASVHMAALFARHGLAHRVHVLPLPPAGEFLSAPRGLHEPVRLAYAGRLERLKGVHLLIDAASEAAARLGRGVELHIAGDGPLRQELARQAASPLGGAVRVVLEGWKDAASRDAWLSSVDAILVPSLWPEPFGLTGLEAGRFGVPACAFASGGIPEWLQDGVNGTLAVERTASGLAAAIVRCVAGEDTYRALSRGAIAATHHLTFAAHAATLEAIFEQVRM